MPTIEMVCWANSRKLGGRCVAGIRTDGGGWIRPVSRCPGGTLTGQQCQLKDDGPVQPLDLVRIRVGEAMPDAVQPENWIVDDGRWELVERPAPYEVIVAGARTCIEHGPHLLGAGLDRVLYDDLARNPNAASLCLVMPESISWEHTWDHFRNRPQERARFSLGPRTYNLAVTDTDWEVLMHGRYCWRSHWQSSEHRLIH
jgi:hypothetical protein